MIQFWSLLCCFLCYFLSLCLSDSLPAPGKDGFAHFFSFGESMCKQYKDVSVGTTWQAILVENAIANSVAGLLSHTCIHNTDSSKLPVPQCNAPRCVREVPGLEYKSATSKSNCILRVFPFKVYKEILWRLLASVCKKRCELWKDRSRLLTIPEHPILGREDHWYAAAKTPARFLQRGKLAFCTLELKLMPYLSWEQSWLFSDTPHIKCSPSPTKPSMSWLPPYWTEHRHCHTPTQNKTFSISTFLAYWHCVQEMQWDIPENACDQEMKTSLDFGAVDEAVNVTGVHGLPVFCTCAFTYCQETGKHRDKMTMVFAHQASRVFIWVEPFGQSPVQGSQRLWPSLSTSILSGGQTLTQELPSTTKWAASSSISREKGTTKMRPNSICVKSQ